jgi:putative hemolysin
MSVGFFDGAAAGALEVDLARRLRGRTEIFAKAGKFEVRLAATEKEIRWAQRLRYRVFFEEGKAVADPIARQIRRDICRFDEVCDHLIVIENSAAHAERAPKVVGAYRLLRQEVAERGFGFYSSREFNVESLIARHPGKRFLELGRSCVADGYRSRRVLELLWRGVWAYALRHRADVMFGCASLRGTDANMHASALRLLCGESAAEPLWSVDAARGESTSLPRPVEGLFDLRETARDLPPLLRGYWRLGAKFSQEVVVDLAFGTTDVFVVLQVDKITPRYLAYFATG